MNHEFQIIQRAFAKQLRRKYSDNDERFGEARRVAIYRRLVHNNIANFVNAVCPVLKSCVEEEAWRGLCARFIETASSNSPYFADIGQGFVQFLQAHPDDPIFFDYPYAAELAHYEIVELMVGRRDGDINLKCQGLQLNLTAEINAYHYPVDEISAEYQPSEPLSELRWLLVYRLQTPTDQVKFVRLQGLTALLLKRIEEHPNEDVAALLDFFEMSLPTMTREQLKKGLLQTLDEFTKRGIVHGFDLSSAIKIQ